MTDTEMTRFLAEKCMGWKYYWQGTAVKLRPTDSWLAENGRECVEIPAIVEHVGWSEGKSFAPLTRIEHAFMLVEKMRERGWYFALGAQSTYRATFYRDASDDGAETKADAIASRAISLAAIAALEGKNK